MQKQSRIVVATQPCPKCSRPMTDHGSEWVCLRRGCFHRSMKPVTGKCEACGTNDANEWNYGPLEAVWTSGWIHMDPKPWCRICVVKDHLELARKWAARIPALEKELQSSSQCLGDGGCSPSDGAGPEV